MSNSQSIDLPNRTVIKDWAAEDRPREKLMLKGIASLSDAELLAILIASGNRNETAVELARRILRQVQDNLNELGRLSVKDLMKFNGIGEAKAITIVAALELGRRRKLSETLERRKIETSRDIFNLFEPLLADLPHEEFWLLLLNRNNRVIDRARLSQGGVSGTVIDVPVVLKTAIDRLASGVAVCHNHPSGNTEPGRQDKEITQKLASAFQLINIAFHDHVIVAGNAYFSFRDNNLL